MLDGGAASAARGLDKRATHGRALCPPGRMGMATTQSSAKKRRSGASAETDGSGVPALLSREPEAQREYYRKMVNIRLFEEASQRGFRQGKVGGYLHLY